MDAVQISVFFFQCALSQRKKCHSLLSVFVFSAGGHKVSIRTTSLRQVFAAFSTCHRTGVYTGRVLMATRSVKGF